MTPSERLRLAQENIIAILNILEEAVDGEVMDMLEYIWMDIENVITDIETNQED